MRGIAVACEIPTLEVFFVFFRRGAIWVGNSTFVCTLSTTRRCSLPTYRCSGSGSSAAARFSQSFPCRGPREALHNPKTSIAVAGMDFCTVSPLSVPQTHIQTDTDTHSCTLHVSAKCVFSPHWAGCYRSVFEDLGLFISSPLFLTFQIALHLHY